MSISPTSLHCLTKPGFVLLTTLYACLAFAIAPASATVKEPSTTQLAQRETINAILAGEAFNATETVGNWRLKGSDTTDDNETPEWLITLVEWLEALFSGAEGLEEGIRGLATVIEVIFWVLLAGMIVYLLYHFKSPVRDFAEGLLRKQSADLIPTAVAGLDITRDSLPDDITGGAMALWRRGRHREAMGLLYRATLSRLAHDYHCGFTASDTEQECLQAARQLPQPQGEPLARLLQQVTDHWLQLAYGHRGIAGERFTSLCGQWQQTFTAEQSREG